MKTLVSIGVLLFMLVSCDSTPQKDKNLNKTTEQAPPTTDAAYQIGEVLFDAKCSVCHRMDAKLIGPPLRQVTARRDEQWMRAFIKNSQQMIDAGDSIANAMFTEYDKTPMTSFEDLTEEQLDQLIHYLKKNADKSKNSQ